MKNVRLGIMGLGNMGATHARNVLAGKVKGLELAAVGDLDPQRLEPFGGVQRYSSSSAMLASDAIDALLIATPHFDHAPTGIAALTAGVHILVEKPIAVHKADAAKLIAAAKKRRRLVFGAVFNQRTDDYFRKIRALIQSGEMGAVRRINWTITNWFRSDAYYSSSAWRATWAGEGGGVLLNQCPHNLDLFQWLFGMPRRVRAFCGFGRYHDIEVEDDVTAYFEFPNGATATIVTSTGEAPGTNRLEIAAENGRLVYEDDRITFLRNEVPMSKFSRTTKELFSRPATTEVPVAADGHGGQHVEILQNFTDAIRRGVPLIAPGAEGIRSVELANAMLLSAWTGETVELPLDARAYERRLEARMKSSRFAKKQKRGRRTAAPANLAKSFGT